MNISVLQKLFYYLPKFQWTLKCSLRTSVWREREREYKKPHTLHRTEINDKQFVSQWKLACDMWWLETRDETKNRLLKYHSVDALKQCYDQRIHLVRCYHNSWPIFDERRKSGNLDLPPVCSGIQITLNSKKCFVSLTKNYQRKEKLLSLFHFAAIGHWTANGLKIMRRRRPSPKILFIGKSFRFEFSLTNSFPFRFFETKIHEWILLTDNKSQFSLSIAFDGNVNIMSFSNDNPNKAIR